MASIVPPAAAMRRGQSEEAKYRRAVSGVSTRLDDMVGRLGCIVIAGTTLLSMRQDPLA